MALGPSRLGRDPLPRSRELAEAEGPCRPARRRDAAPAVRGRRLRRLLRLARPRLQRRPDLPPRRRAAAARTGGTCRSATTDAPAPSWLAVRRSSGPAGSARRRTRTRPPTGRAGGSTSRPSWASWSAPVGARQPDRASPGLRRPRLRGRRPQRLVGPRHPGLGVRAARPVPRQVVRDVGRAWVTPLAALDAAWVRPARAGPGAAAVPRGRAATRGLDIDVEVVLNGEVVSRPPYRTMYWSPAQMLAHLTVNGASTRAPATSSPRAPSADPSRTSAARSSSCRGAGRSRSADGRTFLEDGDEVTLRYSAPGTGGGRITLGEVTGRIEPARP